MRRNEAEGERHGKIMKESARFARRRLHRILARVFPLGSEHALPGIWFENKSERDNSSLQNTKCEATNQRTDHDGLS